MAAGLQRIEAIEPTLSDADEFCGQGPVETVSLPAKRRVGQVGHLYGQPVRAGAAREPRRRVTLALTRLRSTPCSGRKNPSEPDAAKV